MNTPITMDPTEPEVSAMAERLTGIRARRETDPAFRSHLDDLARAIALADDLRADGAELTTSQHAQVVTMLYSERDRMIECFTTIKAAGRTRATKTPRTP